MEMQGGSLDIIQMDIINKQIGDICSDSTDRMNSPPFLSEKEGKKLREPSSSAKNSSVK